MWYRIRGCSFKPRRDFIVTTGWQQMMNASRWIKQFGKKISAEFVAPIWKRWELSRLQRHPVWHWRCHGINNANSSPLDHLNQWWNLYALRVPRQAEGRCMDDIKSLRLCLKRSWKNRGVSKSDCWRVDFQAKCMIYRSYVSWDKREANINCTVRTLGLCHIIERHSIRYAPPRTV